MSYEPNRFQKEIYRTVEERNDPYLVVEAVAGSGKTTTLIEMANRLKGGKGIIVAFSKAIQEELAKRLPPFSFGGGFNARTIHSIGNEVIRNTYGNNVQLNNYKYGAIARYVLTGVKDFEFKEIIKIQRGLTKLMDLSRVHLISPDDMVSLKKLGLYHDISMLDEVLKYFPALVKEGEKVFQEQKLIDYTDMIYLPLKMKLEYPKYDFIFTDECQDLNKAQFFSSGHLRENNAISVYVGDRNQAIFGFAGANARSFENIIATTNAKLLPLSICYRCPTSHIEAAKEYVPAMEASPTAREGEIISISPEEIYNIASPGDIIMSRFNSPLIGICIRFIKHGKKALIKGIDIAYKIISMAEEVEELGGFSWVNFEGYLSLWLTSKKEELIRNDISLTQIRTVEDIGEACRFIFREYNPRNIKQFETATKSLFPQSNKEDEELKSDIIWLSSIHKAKGLEARNTFIIERSKLPFSTNDMSDWQFIQEQNLTYVALTRAKEKMYFVEKEATWSF